MPVIFNEDAELNVLACCLKFPETVDIIQDIISPKTFYWVHYRTLYKVFYEMWENQLNIDKNTLEIELDKRGLLDVLNGSKYDFFSEKTSKIVDFLSNLDVNKENIESYAYQVAECKNARDVNEMLEHAKEDLLSGQYTSKVLAYLDVQNGKIALNSGAKTNAISDSVSAVTESKDIVYNALLGESLYIQTGLSAWDDFTGGLYPQRLYIIGGGTGDGKSALAATLVNNINISGVKIGRKIVKHKCGYITLEMDKLEMVFRFVQQLTGIPPIRMERGRLTDKEKIKFEEAMDLVEKSGILFDDSVGLTIPLLRTKLRKMVDLGAEVIVIDQLELLIPPPQLESKSDATKLNWIGYRIKDFAREFNIPIVLPHQISRAINSGNNRGKDVDAQAQDLANGGDKGADAVVIIRHKKEKQEIISSSLAWVKNRQGEKKKQLVDFIGKNIYFKDIENSLPEELMSDEENQYDGIGEYNEETDDEFKGELYA